MAAFIVRVPRAAMLLAALAAGLSACAEDHAKDGGERAAPALTPHLLDMRGDSRFRHAQYLTAVAPLPGGKRVLTASRDGYVRLWDLESGKELRRFGEKQAFWGLAPLPDGKSFLASGDDKTVHAWDLESGKVLHEYTGAVKRFFRCTATPDGSRIVSGCEDGTLFVWAAGKQEPLHRLTGHRDAVYGVAVAPDGRTAASCGKKMDLRLWDIQEGKQLRELEGHVEDVHTVLFDTNGERLVSASEDKTVRCWNVADGTQLWSFTADDEVYTLAWSPDGKTIAATVNDRSIRILDAASGEQRRRIGVGDKPWPVAFAAGSDGAPVLLAGISQVLCRFDATGGKRLFPPPDQGIHFGTIAAIWPLPSGEVMTYENKRVLRWTRDGRAERFAGGEDVDSLLIVSPDGKLGVRPGEKSELKVYDMATLKVIETVSPAMEARVRYRRWTAAGLRAVATYPSRDDEHGGRVEIWDERLERKLASLKGPAEWMQEACISADGNCLMAVFDDYQLHVWHVASGRPALVENLVHKEKGSGSDLCYLDASGVLLAYVDGRLQAWRGRRPSGWVDIQEVRRLEKQLGSEEFQARADAVEALVSLGPAVKPHLTPPEKAEDMEVRARLKQVREQLDFASLPTVPVVRGAGDAQGQVLALPGDGCGLHGHPDGRHFTVSTFKDGCRSVWWGEVTDDGLRLLQKLDFEGGEPTVAIAFSPDGKYLYVGTNDTRYAVFELK